MTNCMYPAVPTKNDSPKYSEKEILGLLLGYNIIKVKVDGKNYRFYRSGHPTLCPSEMFCEDLGDHVSGCAGMDEAKSIAKKIYTLQQYCASCKISISYFQSTDK